MVESGVPACPGCGGPLTLGERDGCRCYTCRSCGGMVVGVAVLRGLLAPGVAQRLWTAEAAASSTVAIRCPFCSRLMTPRSVDEGRAGVCRPCEMVWLDRAALTRLPASPRPQAAPLSTSEVTCPKCGAPVLHSWEERCAYCGAVLVSPTRVLVLPSAHRVRGVELPRPLQGAAWLLRAAFDLILAWWPW